MENETEVIDSQTDDVAPETENTEETVVEKEITLDDYNALKEKNKQLFERAKKAELEAKKLKPLPKEINETNTQPGLSRKEAALLISEGITLEELETAEKLAKINNIPLEEAIKDDYIQTKIAQRRKNEVSRKAQLPPSSGGGVAPSKPVGQMSRDEHADYMRKVMNS